VLHDPLLSAENLFAFWNNRGGSQGDYRGIPAEFFGK
jgi:hypothetical protein